MTAIKRFAAALATRLHTAIDLRDIIVFTGLSAAVYGISMVHVPAAWIVCGATLFCIGVFGIPRR